MTALGNVLKRGGVGDVRLTHFMVGALILGPLAFTLAASGLLAQQIPDTPQRRWEFFWSQRAYPLGNIPAGAYQAARRRAASIPFAAPPPVSGTQWQPLGPERIPIFGQSTGRISSVAIDPTNSSVIYVGGAQGGVWKTVDGGNSWSPMTDGECSLAMGAIAIDPVNPNILYAGTGEQHFSGDSYYGCGVLRSDNGGTTWVNLGAAVFQTNQGGARISRIVIDPATAGSVSATTVLVASDFGLYRSTNSGGTWTQVLQGTATDLVQDPVTPATHYAAINRGQVHRSADAGQTWTPVANGFPTTDVGRINLAIAPSAPTTLYASVQNDTALDLLGIYKTVDGGTTWTTLTATGAGCGNQCWYDMTLAVHPNGADTVYFGGVDLFKSVDGGATFTLVTGGIHVDQHILVFDPNNPNILYAGNDGGIYRTNDGAATWFTLNTNLELTQFYGGVSLHPTDANIMMGGTQDNGTISYSGSPDWGEVLGGDGGFTAIDGTNPVVRYAETQWTPNSSFSGPRRSDGGLFERKVNGINTADDALFIPPLVMDRTNSDVLYFGTSRLYQTTDRAETWTVFNDNISGDVVSAIAPFDANTVYVGTRAGTLDVTFDGGATWFNRDNGLPNRFLTDIAVDGSNPLTAYAVFSGFLTNHVFKTTDGGVSWQSIDANLPDIPVNAILLDPGNPNGLFVGTDLGVFTSTDGGATWTAFNAGLPNVAVFDLAYNPGTGTLVAATHGRGMFGLQMATPLFLEVTPVSRADSAPDGSTEAIPDSAEVVVGGTGGSTLAWSATHGAAAWLTLTTASGVGTGSVQWTRSPSGLSSGTYIDTITVTADGAVGSPVQIVDSLVILPSLTLAVTPSSRADSVVEGNTTPIPDSANVVLTGTDPANAAWTAASKANWTTVTTPAGTGPGAVRWNRDPTGLIVGTYVDTITVTSAGAVGSPAIVVDTLRVVSALAVAVTPSSQADSAFVGDVDARQDSANVIATGFGAEAAAWTATKRSTWLTLTTPSGQGTGPLRWSRSPVGLAAGTYVDTITVTLSGAAQTASLVDTLRVLSVPITVAEAASALLNSTAVTPAQSAYLDSRGNGDGTFNLGDFLALLDRLGSAATGTRTAQLEGERATRDSVPGRSQQ